MKKRSIKNLKLKKVKISNFKAEKIKAGSYLPHICIAQTIIYGGTVVASWLAGCNDDKKKKANSPILILSFFMQFPVE